MEEEHFKEFGQSHPFLMVAGVIAFITAWYTIVVYAFSFV